MSSCCYASALSFSDDIHVCLSFTESWLRNCELYKWFCKRLRQGTYWGSSSGCWRPLLERSGRKTQERCQSTQRRGITPDLYCQENEHKLQRSNVRRQRNYFKHINHFWSPYTLNTYNTGPIVVPCNFHISSAWIDGESNLGKSTELLQHGMKPELYCKRYCKSPWCYKQRISQVNSKKLS